MKNVAGTRAMTALIRLVKGSLIGKQNVLSGTKDQVVGFDTNGNAIPIDRSILKGESGKSAGFGTPTASVDDNVGTPSVTVTATGEDTAKVFNFIFKNLKGATGTKGDTGAAAGFGTVTATVDSNTGTPTVSVTTDGTNESKNFAFSFKNLKGATGAAGTRGSQIYYGAAITGTSTTGTTFSSSGITSALLNDLYINTSTWNVYQCTTAGAPSVAKWTYKGNIKGDKGEAYYPTFSIETSTGNLIMEVPDQYPL